MIKALAKTDKGPLMIFGLSRENIERLQKGQPIKIDLSEMGMEGHAMIFAGDTEATMAAELAELIGPDTKVSGATQ